MNVYLTFFVLVLYFFNVSKASDITYEIPCGISKYTLSNRIVGGTPASPHEFPWIVSIQVYINGEYFHNCGGTIVHSKFILTAGHCLYDYPQELLLVKAGLININQTNEYVQAKTVEKIYYNGYDEENFDKDIALIKLNESLKLVKGYVVPGCVPKNPVDINVTKKGIVAGWGRLKENGTLPDELMKVTLPFIKYSDCVKMYKHKGYGINLHNCQICALSNETKDSCQGDSGGALMCVDSKTSKINICAIVSWGAGCARKEFPGVYTEVSCFYDWIAKTINNNVN